MVAVWAFFTDGLYQSGAVYTAHATVCLGVVSKGALLLDMRCLSAKYNEQHRQQLLLQLS